MCRQLFMYRIVYLIINETLIDRLGGRVDYLLREMSRTIAEMLDFHFSLLVGIKMERMGGSVFLIL